MELLLIALGLFVIFYRGRPAASRTARALLGAGLVLGGVLERLEAPPRATVLLRLVYLTLLGAGLVLLAREGWLARTFLPWRSPRGGETAAAQDRTPPGA